MIRVSEIVAVSPARLAAGVTVRDERGRVLDVRTRAELRDGSHVYLLATPDEVIAAVQSGTPRMIA